MRAIQPVGFFLPGCKPANWQDDIEAGKELDECLGERAKHIQGHIDETFKVIDGNAGKFKWGAWFGIAAPFVGIVVWAISSAVLK